MVYLYDVLCELTPVGDSVVEDCSLNLSEPKPRPGPTSGRAQDCL